MCAAQDGRTDEKLGLEAHRVLLLGKSNAQMAALGTTLVELGFAVVGRALTGDEARELGASQDAHLVLMDVPGPSARMGIRAAKALQQQSGLPVLCLIPAGDQRAINEVFACNLPGFLLKPLHKEGLTAAIDIALQRHWEGRIRAGRNREEGAVAELAALLLSAESIEEMNLLVLEKAKELTLSPVGFVGHMDLSTGKLVTSTKRRDRRQEPGAPGESNPLDGFSGLSDWVLREGQPLVANRPWLDPRSKGGSAGPACEGRFLSVPVKDGEAVMGQIVLANAPRDYTDEDLDVAARLAILYALAIKRHRAEDAVRERDQWLKEAQRVARIGCFTYDPSKGSFVTTELVGEIFGFKADQAIDLVYWLSMIHPDDREWVRSEAKRLVAAKQPLNQQYRIVRQDDGEVRWISGRGVITLAASGVVEKIFGTVQDITEQVIQTRSHQEQEMLAAIGGIASHIAHEVKNPLFAISSGIQLLMDELSLSDEQRETFEVVHKDVNRMDRLVRQLQIFNARREPQKSRQAVASLVREAVTLNRGLLADKLIQVEVACDPDLPELSVDRDQIHQVLINLIQNAIATSPNDGRIEVEATRSHDLRGVLIRVRDSGPGIPEKIIDRIFDPSFTTKRSSAGMGLAISRSIAKDHGGTLTAANDPGGGAVFSLELPTEAPA